jgi:dUTP pyrophosphatase
MTNILIEKLKIAENLDLPSYATSESAGLDLLAAIDKDCIINPGEIVKISAGIKIALPKFYEAQIRPRSGLAAKNGITVLNSPGTIDSDYRGEILVILINHSKVSFTIERGMRIAQMVISKFEHISWDEGIVDEESSVRGAKGFGSTGIK